MTSKTTSAAKARSRPIAQSNGAMDPLAESHPTLNEIQIRAYHVHQQRGGIYGGYTLEEWLQAEHDLDDELRKNPKQKRRKPFRS
jgi:hypothetical protein